MIPVFIWMITMRWKKDAGNNIFPPNGGSHVKEFKYRKWITRIEVLYFYIMTHIIAYKEIDLPLYK